MSEFNPMQWLSDRDDEYVAKLREARPRKATADKPHSWTESAQEGLIGIHTMNTRETMPKAREFSPAYEKMLQYGSTAARYAAPALGVTAAGIALADLAGYFGGSPDQPEQGQLGLNNGEMSALGVIAAAPIAAGAVGLGMGLFPGEEVTAGNDAIETLKQAQAEADAAQPQHQASAKTNQLVRAAGRRRKEERARAARRRR